MNVRKLMIVIACALAAAQAYCVQTLQAKAQGNNAAEAVGDAANAGSANAGYAKIENDPDFDKYKTIISRMPFGKEPANFNPDAPGTSGAAGGGAGANAADDMQKLEEEMIISAVRVSAINVTPSGKIAVGFTDKSKQPEANYYLKVGESRDGWTVKEADARELNVTLEKDGVEATVKLGGTAGDAPGGRRGGKMPQVRSGAQAQCQPLMLNSPPQQQNNNTGILGLRHKRALREEQMREEQERKAAADEQARLDRERRDAERQAEREQAEAERAQQRALLQAIQEDLRKSREQSDRLNQDKMMQQQQQQPAEEGVRE